MNQRISLLAIICATACTSTFVDMAPDVTVPDVPTSEQLVSQLSAAAWSQLCDEFRDYVFDTYRSDYLVQAACTAHALSTTADAAACGAATNACIQDVPAVVVDQVDAMLAQAGCPQLMIDQATCGVTVSAVKTCLDALATTLDEMTYGLVCASAGSPVPTDWWRIATPAACQAIIEGC